MNQLLYFLFYSSLYYWFNVSLIKISIWLVVCIFIFCPYLISGRLQELFLDDRVVDTSQFDGPLILAQLIDWFIRRPVLDRWHLRPLVDQHTELVVLVNQLLLDRHCLAEVQGPCFVLTFLLSEANNFAILLAWFSHLPLAKIEFSLENLVLIISNLQISLHLYQAISNR